MITMSVVTPTPRDHAADRPTGRPAAYPDAPAFDQLLHRHLSTRSDDAATPAGDPYRPQQPNGDRADARPEARPDARHDRPAAVAPKEPIAHGGRADDSRADTEDQAAAGAGQPHDAAASETTSDPEADGTTAGSADDHGQSAPTPSPQAPAPAPDAATAPAAPGAGAAAPLTGVEAAQPVGAAAASAITAPAGVSTAAIGAVPTSDGHLPVDAATVTGDGAAAPTAGQVTGEGPTILAVTVTTGDGATRTGDMPAADAAARSHQGASSGAVPGPSPADALPGTAAPDGVGTVPATPTHPAIGDAGWVEAPSTTTTTTTTTATGTATATTTVAATPAPATVATSVAAAAATTPAAGPTASASTATTAATDTAAESRSGTPTPVPGAAASTAATSTGTPAAPGATGAEAATLARTHDAVAQAQRELQIRRAEQVTQLSVDVATDGLGPIHIEASNAAGGLQLQLGSDRAATRQLLADHAAALRDELGSNGTAVSVDVGHSQTGTRDPDPTHADGRDLPAWSGPRAAAQHGVVQSAPSAPITPRRATERGVDVHL